ncbi:hypothetical protein [Agromyces sp. SYSU T0242]|uniref:hypothetical protein n=1 Tax=Agromyces litoreus TaxID=3158561 RepID=UPI0033920D79
MDVQRDLARSSLTDERDSGVPSTPDQAETAARGRADPAAAQAPTRREALAAGRLRQRPEAERMNAAERLAKRLDRPMGILGIVFLFVVLGQVLAQDPTLVTVFSVLGWIFWAIFVAEFALRAWVARSAAFWRRNWWQVVFLAVPFLRFFRVLTFFRVAPIARLGGVLTAGVRGSRSAGRLLSDRIAWLAAVTAVVILAASQLHYLTGDGISYGEALYETALATVTGAPLEGDSPLTRILHVALSVYSVVVFATLAGSLGAYFLQKPVQRRREADVAVDEDALVDDAALADEAETGTPTEPSEGRTPSVDATHDDRANGTGGRAGRRDPR